MIQAMEASVPGEGPDDEGGPFPDTLTLVIVRENDEILCLARGPMDSANAPMLGRRLRELAGETPSRLVIDMEHVEFLGSAVITALLAARAAAAARGKRVQLQNLPPQVRSILEVTGLIKALGA